MGRRLFIKLLLAVLILSLAMGQGIAKKTKAEKAAVKLAKMEKKIEKILGTNTNWKPTVLKDLRLNMPCKEVKKYFKRLKCSSYKKYSFPKVSGKLFGTVKEYKFTFKYGKLQSVKIIFGARVFDQKRFYTALLNVAQRKWGVLSKEKLAKKYKFWYNGDRDRVSLSYYNSNYQLEVSMPRRDTGDVTAGSLSKKEIAQAMVKLLGSSKYWVVPAVGKLKRGMYCGQVLQVYNTMRGCDPTKNYSRGTITIKNHPLVHALFLSFKKGQLYSAKLVFHRQLPREVTKIISLIAFEKKWGKVKPAKRNEDYISYYRSGYGFARRNWMTDHWEISFDFPK